jgi:hypothetical protein
MSEDIIDFKICGSEVVYYYALHAEPHLSLFIKNAISIKVSIFIEPYMLFNFSYNESFRLFLSGKILSLK